VELLLGECGLSHTNEQTKHKVAQSKCIYNALNNAKHYRGDTWWLRLLLGLLLVCHGKLGQGTVTGHGGQGEARW